MSLRPESKPQRSVQSISGHESHDLLFPIDEETPARPPSPSSIQFRSDAATKYGNIPLAASNCTPQSFYTATPGSLVSYRSAKSHSTPYSQAKKKHEIFEDLDWSGRGQHVTFRENDQLPFDVEPTPVDSGSTAIVDIVQCRRIRLARKRIRYNRKFSIDEALYEVKLLQKLRHAHVIQLVGSYFQGKYLAILLYPVADTNLKDLLDELEQNPNTSERPDLMVYTGCLVHALNYIHQCSVKHGDIKPANILVRIISSEEQYRFYIADFGASKQFEEQSQTDNIGWRSTKYCAPEVADNDFKGRVSDIFSLACVFVEMLTVSVGRSLDDMAYEIWGRSPEVFHHSTDKVKTWISSILIDSTPNTPLMDRHGIDVPKRNHKLLEALSKMLEMDQTHRPFAGQLLEFFPGQKCCLSGSEPYESVERQRLSAARNNRWGLVDQALQKGALSISDPCWMDLARAAASQRDDERFISLMGLAKDSLIYANQSTLQEPRELNSIILGFFHFDPLGRLDNPRRSTNEATSNEFALGRYIFIRWTMSARNIDWSGSEGTVMYHWACVADRKDLIEVCLHKFGGHLSNSSTHNLLCQLMLDLLLLTAVIECHEEAVKNLLEIGADVNAELNFGSDIGTILMQGLRHQDLRITQMLLEYGALANKGSKPNKAALRELCRKDPTARMLVPKVRVDDSLSCTTALMKAAYFGSPDTVKMLLDYGAEVNFRDNKGWTALRQASIGGITGTIKTLLHHGADINTADVQGLTPLMEASSRYNTDTVRSLLDFGADPNCQDVKGETALMLASSSEQKSGEIIQILLNRGADANIQNYQGRTALMQALIAENYEKAETLVDSGAEVNLEDHYGWTALGLVSRQNMGSSIVIQNLRRKLHERT